MVHVDHPQSRPLKYDFCCDYGYLMIGSLPNRLSCWHNCVKC